MTVADAARALEVSGATVRALCKAGRLGHYRIGLGRGRIRIDPGQLAAFRRGCERAAPGPVPDPAPAARRPTRPESLSEALDHLTRLRDPDA